jgi:NAD-dependent deacetylase
VQRNYCERCHKFYDLAYVVKADGVPKCSCGGDIKPDVVLSEEPLDSAVTGSAIKAIAAAQVLIIGGTSLAVYPAAGLVDYYQGSKLVLINKAPTPRDARADLLIQGGLGEVFGGIAVA